MPKRNKPRKYLTPPKSAHRKLSNAEIEKAVAAVIGHRDGASSNKTSVNQKRRKRINDGKSKGPPEYLEPPKSAFRRLSDEVIERAVAEVIAEREKAS
jgi:hypothetical protein